MTETSYRFNLAKFNDKIVSCGSSENEKTIKVWDNGTNGTFLKTLEGHNSRVFRINFFNNFFLTYQL